VYILGLSAYYHDSAAALLKDGDIIAAAQEERFTRIKYDAGFPKEAVRYCLEEAGISLAEVGQVVFFEKPLRKFNRIRETFLGVAPKGASTFPEALGLWMGGKRYQAETLKRELLAIDPAWAGQLLFSEHHLSHAASAFYPSPYEEAVVLTMDGVGEWATTSVAIGRGNRLDIVKELEFPHSLGLLYAAFTAYTGFKVNSGEYKVMGLAPYGEPRFADLILGHLVDLKPDGSFRLNQAYFTYAYDRRMTNARFDALFGGPPRRPEAPLEQRHMDLAASIQAATETIVLRMTRALAEETGIRNLCLAGGVALNCVANGKILRDGRFDGLWIQPAAGDAGGALGAALHAHYGPADQGGGGHSRTPQPGDAMKGSYLGPQFSQDQIEARLAAAGAYFEVFDDTGLVWATAEHLEKGQAVGWMQGRMEFGPRSLGCRSILGDPRSPKMQKLLNLKVKYRESFRPFAPSVLREDVADWFELDGDSPYMLLVADVRPELRRQMTAEEEALFGIDKLNVPRSSIPAVTHVDYSARVQTVTAAVNPRYHALLSRFKALTGCGVLVNTSFNVRGEPVVCSPEDAFRCFMGTDLDILVVGNCFLRKDQQDLALILDYSDAFELD
jgi:carbamoyltransferase